MRQEHEVLLEKEHKQVRRSILLLQGACRHHDDTGQTLSMCHRLKKPSGKPAQRRARRMTTFRPGSRSCKQSWRLSRGTARQPSRCVTKFPASPYIKCEGMLPGADAVSCMHGTTSCTQRSYGCLRLAETGRAGEGAAGSKAGCGCPGCSPCACACRAGGQIVRSNRTACSSEQGGNGQPSSAG